MPSLVYIAEISQTTILHCSTRGNSAYIRDYSDIRIGRNGPIVRPIIGYTTAQVEQLLTTGNNFRLQAPNHNTKDLAFWVDHISTLNVEHNLAPLPPPEIELLIAAPPKPRAPNLVARFKNDVKPLILLDRRTELTAVLNSWRLRLTCVKDRHRLNRWDVKSAGHVIGVNDGIGWTAAMLELCRTDGQLNYIDVGIEWLNFALIGMDVHLGISSRFNMFRTGEKDYVKPDGLGLRQHDSSICVLEVKGPQDDGNPYEATLQALCGALALHAKRELFQQLLLDGHGLRPAAPNVQIHESEPTLGLYILISQGVAENVPDLDHFMTTILASCPWIREICHFLVGDEPDFAQLPSPKVFRRQ